MSDWLTKMQKKSQRLSPGTRKFLVSVLPFVIAIVLAITWGTTVLRKDLAKTDMNALSQGFAEISAELKTTFQSAENEQAEKLDTTRSFLPRDDENQPSQRLTDASTPRESWTKNESVLFDGIGLTVTNISVFNDHTTLNLNIYNSEQTSYQWSSAAQLTIQKDNEIYYPLPTADSLTTLDPENMTATNLRFLAVAPPFEIRISNTNGNTQTLNINNS